MHRNAFALTGITALLLGTMHAAQATTIQWVDWTAGQKDHPYSPYYGTITGIATVDGTPITVTLNGSFSVSGTQLDGGIDYWSVGNAYLSPPSNEDVIHTSSVFSIQFSQPVTDPVIAVANFNRYSRDAQWMVDTPNVRVLSHGRGLFGDEVRPLQIDETQANRILGARANGILLFARDIQ